MSKKISLQVERLRKQIKKAKCDIQTWKWNYKQKERELISFVNLQNKQRDDFLSRIDGLEIQVRTLENVIENWQEIYDNILKYFKVRTIDELKGKFLVLKLNQKDTDFIKELRRRIDKCKEKYTSKIISGSWGGIMESILNVDKFKE